MEDAIDDVLTDHPDNGDVLSAVVLDANAKKIVAVRQNGDNVEIVGDGLKPAQSGLGDKAPPHIPNPARRRDPCRTHAQGCLGNHPVARSGRCFRCSGPAQRAVKAWWVASISRRTSSTTSRRHGANRGRAKPFIYSSALEKGFTPATVINDGPLFFEAGATGARHGNRRTSTASSKGPCHCTWHWPSQKTLSPSACCKLWDRNTPNPGSGSLRSGQTPSLSDHGPGRRLGHTNADGHGLFGIRQRWLPGQPVAGHQGLDHRGKTITEITPPVLAEEQRAIPERNAFVMDSLLQEVARSGTAARAQATLKRPDLYGKTGTTNDSMDAWFAGFQPLAAITWVGYDTPRNLGDRETGGGLSLPIWISFMESALKGVSVAKFLYPPASSMSAEESGSTMNTHAMLAYQPGAGQQSEWSRHGRGRRCYATCCTSQRGAEQDPGFVPQLSTAAASCPGERKALFQASKRRGCPAWALASLVRQAKTRLHPWCRATALPRSGNGSHRIWLRAISHATASAD